MENICRIKKRTVYPEMMHIDQIGVSNNVKEQKLSASWCNVRSTKDEKIIKSGNKKRQKIETLHDRIKTQSFDSDDTINSANNKFVQDRLVELAQAFNNRAKLSRKRIELPATPSSSHETLESTLESKMTKKKKRSIAEILPSSTKFLFTIDNFNPKPSPLLLGNNGKNVVDPQGKTYVAWMCIATAAVLYNAWMIPLRSAFPYQTPENRIYWMFFDYLMDLIYLLDILLVQPRIMFLYQGFWIRDIYLTRQNYFKKTVFKLDVLSLLPTDFLYFIYGPEHVSVRFPRFLKLHTAVNFFNLVDKLIASPHIIRITRTLIYMMYLIHINACGYYAFSAFEGIGSNNFVFNGQGSAYIKCFYFATKTATSIGKNPKPTQEIEYMFMTVSWLMGVFVFAILIGQIRDIIATATRSQTEYRKLVDETLEYMRILNLPQDMQRRAQLWFNYTWEKQNTLDDNTILDCLPHKMKTDIAINVHANILNKVKLFADCDEALLRELVVQLKSVIYLPDDIICKKGEIGKEMYIVQSGKVQVIGSTANEVLATLSEGSVFGEISLLGIPGMNRRTADVRSQGYSNLFVLSKADLNAALSHYPEAQSLLNKKAKHLMQKNAEIEEKKNKAHIVINNPTTPSPHAKLIDTVLKAMPPNSKTNKLLRFGSRGWPKKNVANERFKMHNSLPCITNNDNENDSKCTGEERYRIDGKFVTKVTVHRSMT